jgi:hypothetical protein
MIKSEHDTEGNAMQKFFRLAIAIGIGLFLFTKAPDLIKSAAVNLQDQATGIMPVAMR